MHVTTVAALLVLLSLALSVRSAQAGDRLTGRPFATRSEVFARTGMAATSQPLATQAALDILKAGGSAVDAAIAANAVLAVVEPTGSGVGGDLFAIVWDQKTRTLSGLNASGRSPRGLTLDALRKTLAEQELEAIPPFGPLPVSVPGCVDGWTELHGRFGALPLAAVLAPAIRYAREGAPISQVIAYHWRRGADVFRDQPGFAKTFLVWDGEGPRAGDVFRNKALADTFEQIAKHGRDGFYAGEVAERIDAFCRRVGCALRKSDLAAHHAEWVEPVSTTYRGYEVFELPPNGQGIAALQMLNLLEPCELQAMGHNSAAYLHHLVEAKKIAFEDRARFYADMSMADVPLETLVSKAYAERRRRRLDPETAAKQVVVDDPRLETGDTVYLTVADADRNMVSLIQSNYRGFGSGLCPDGLGFCLQDRGQLFSLEDDHANVYAPGKRPFHTIIPAFVMKDGTPFLSFGVMGGSMQPQGHVQILLNIIEFGMNLQEAGDAPRFNHSGSSQPTGERMTDGGLLGLESGIGEAARDGLSARGHTIDPSAAYFGGYQGIGYDAKRDLWIGASESRKDGHAAGY